MERDLGRRKSERLRSVADKEQLMYKEKETNRTMHSPSTIIEQVNRN